MALHPALRRTIGGLAGLLLMWLTWEGISGGVTQWSGSDTAWQRAQDVTQFAYGAFALLSLITAFRWRQFRKYSDLFFVINASAAAGLATVVWGEESVLAGVASAIAAAAIAGAIVWMLRVGTGSR